MATSRRISVPAPERRRQLIEHVRRRAFERIAIDFEINDGRYDELLRRCRERRGSLIGTRGQGEVWRLQVWGGVILYAIFRREANELVTVISETMFRENWIGTHDYRVRRRR